MSVQAILFATWTLSPKPLLQIWQIPFQIVFFFFNIFPVSQRSKCDKYICLFLRIDRPILNLSDFQSLALLWKILNFQEYIPRDQPKLFFLFFLFFFSESVALDYQNLFHKENETPGFCRVPPPLGSCTDRPALSVYNCACSSLLY